MHERTHTQTQLRQLSHSLLYFIVFSLSSLRWNTTTYQWPIYLKIYQCLSCSLGSQHCKFFKKKNEDCLWQSLISSDNSPLLTLTKSWLQFLSSGRWRKKQQFPIPDGDPKWQGRMNMLPEVITRQRPQQPEQVSIVFVILFSCCKMKRPSPKCPDVYMNIISSAS